MRCIRNRRRYIRYLRKRSERIKKKDKSVAKKKEKSVAEKQKRSRYGNALLSLFSLEFLSEKTMKSVYDNEPNNIPL